jgi:hypothetical protein
MDGRNQLARSELGASLGAHFAAQVTARVGSRSRTRIAARRASPADACVIGSGCAKHYPESSSLASLVFALSTSDFVATASLEQIGHPLGRQDVGACQRACGLHAAAN